jgi:hypothetical protein
VGQDFVGWYNAGELMEKGSLVQPHALDHPEARLEQCLDIHIENDI